ncbi:ras-related protein Rab-24 isoform X1 [Megalobrama amblycephala]|uniref:ras-related protein Rab-24 isoform X1 n=1 Tax=Megalobrama amblycephala TaxID=75352 RepID=UPI0020145BA1|nr:ras-related protein Rab-24 isoform X1 [Megalobrama amblycephala]
MTAMRVDAKVVMLGKESVGKTSLVERYVHRRFLVGPYQNTIGAAFVAKALNVGDKVVTLGIWDTAGSERYEAMSRIYYRGARAAIVCYDLTDSSSFKRARFWVKELQNCEEHCKIYLCGTKSDLIEADRSVRQVDFHDVQDFADEIGAQHFETSSKTGKNVDEVFQKVAEDFSSCALEFMQGTLFGPENIDYSKYQQCMAIHFTKKKRRQVSFRDRCHCMEMIVANFHKQCLVIHHLL